MIVEEILADTMGELDCHVPKSTGLQIGDIVRINTATGEAKEITGCTAYSNAIVCGRIYTFEDEAWQEVLKRRNGEDEEWYS